MADQSDEAVAAALVALHEAIDGVRRAYKTLEAAIDGIEDPRRAYEVATQVTDEIAPHLDGLQRTGETRGRQVVRIRDRESLTIAELAKRVDLSPSRAHQLIAAGKGAATPPKEERP